MNKAHFAMQHPWFIFIVFI